MKITSKILSIPPYISTTWSSIASLQLIQENAQPVLLISLNNQSTVKVPGLEEATLKQIFFYYEQSLEQESPSNEPLKTFLKSQHPLAISGSNTMTMGFPFKFSDMESFGKLDSMGNLLEHNQEQADAPDLPEEFISKIASVSKALGLDQQLEGTSQAEPHCNCPYCQITRALQAKEPLPKKEEEPFISEEDLKFRDWDIVEKKQNLYDVTNPLDTAEKYQVFLGNPVGCTCGNPHCEHIKAVLNS
ncbi:MAG: hypothetical protein FJZ63_01640 [Chlamydiae bacterium]|nr:hypothetical protein [Chlamydiota bacterium]